MTRVVGRLAPSPTGAQHLGNARTYLIAWLSARSRDGRVLLRIEDVDSPRTRPGAVEQTFVDLRWLGLTWDAEPVVQTTRLPLYEQALPLLQAQERVYPCTCTRSDVERAASTPHLDHEGPVYPGTCAGRRASDAAALEREGRMFCWRFRVPERSPSFEDGFRGLYEIDLHQMGGDFVVWKTARTPAYQLSVVVDDAVMGVTEVVRGDDLVALDAAAIAAVRSAFIASAAVRSCAAGRRRGRPAVGETARRYTAGGASRVGRAAGEGAGLAGMVVRLDRPHT